MRRENRNYTELERSYDAERVDFFNKEFFIYDMNILLDFSMIFVRKVISIIYSNIFFGNRIYITEETLEKLRKISTDENEYSECKKRSAKLILEMTTYDSESRIRVIAIKNREVAEYVKSQKNMILYVSSISFYANAQKMGVRVKLYNKYSGVYNERSINYTTVGALTFDEKSQMCLEDGYSKPGTTKKVYSAKLVEKKGQKVKINVGDYIVIRVEKTKIITLLIYRVVNYHSKNNSIKLIWTDIKKDDVNRFHYKCPELEELIIRNL